MKDCSSCKHKPKAGEEYYKTVCCRCFAWEPSENHKGKYVQKPSWWWNQYDNKEARGLDTLPRI